MPVTLSRSSLTYDAAGDVASGRRPLFPPAEGESLDFSTVGVVSTDALEGRAPAVDNAPNDWPSVSQLRARLLDAYRLATAEPVTEASELPGWRRDLLDELKALEERICDDRPVAAQFAFLAALAHQEAQHFFESATVLLRDTPSLSRQQWVRFVDAAARAASVSSYHEALPPVDYEDEPDAAPVEVSPDLVTLAYLRSRVHRGAMRRSPGVTAD